MLLTSTPAWAARTPCSAAMRAFSIRPHVKIGWMMLTVPRTNTPVMSGEYWSSGEETWSPRARGDGPSTVWSSNCGRPIPRAWSCLPR